MEEEQPPQNTGDGGEPGQEHPLPPSTGDELPFPDLGEGLPGFGDEVNIPGLGDEPALPNLGEGLPLLGLGDGPELPALGDGPALPGLGDELQLSGLGDEAPLPGLGEDLPLPNLGDDLQFLNENMAAAVKNTAAQKYLFTRSPSSSSGTGSEGQEVSDDPEFTYEPPQRFSQAPAPVTGSAVEVDNSALEIETGENGTSQVEGTTPEGVKQDDNDQQMSMADMTEASWKWNQESSQDGGEYYDPFAEHNLYEGNVKQEEGREAEDDAGTENIFKIFVSNLPPGLLSSELKEMFEKFGEVDACEIFAKNYAFVHMASEECGNQAMTELHGLDIRGCKINVKRSVQTGSSVHNSSSSFLQSKKPVMGPLLEVGTYKLFIGNLSPDVTKEDVEKLINGSECGRVVEVEIFRNSSAFVHMETEEGGRLVIERLNGKSLPESEKLLRVTDSNNPRGPSLATMKFKVKYLSPSITADELRNLFSPYGLVLGVKIIPKIYPDFGGSRHADVLLEQYGNIRSAIKELSGKEVDGIKLSVEARFGEDAAPPTSQPQRNFRTSMFVQDDSSWHNNSFPPVRHPPPSRGFGSPRMRLIPMPSQADLQRFPRGRGNRGRNLLRQRPSFGQPPPLFSSGGFGEDGYGYDESMNEGYIPPMKRSRESWNNSGGGNNFNQQNGNRGNGQGNGGQGQFPDFPNDEEFPSSEPPSLMSMQFQQQNSTENCDWSDDLPISSLSGNFSTGEQDFATDGPSMTATTHAVPFDYSQLNNRRPKQGNMNMQRNNPPPRNFSNNNRGNNSRSGGKGKKGKPRRPGLGSSQQVKTFSNQAGTGETSQDATFPTAGPGPTTSTQPLFTGGNAAPVNQGASSGSSFTPQYFQQNWSFKSKRQTGSRPSAKQIKDSEEEQKKLYANYLKQKPWLYQAIPGTVKRVDK